MGIGDCLALEVLGSSGLIDAPNGPAIRLAGKQPSNLGVMVERHVTSVPRPEVLVRLTGEGTLPKLQLV